MGLLSLQALINSKLHSILNTPSGRKEIGANRSKFALHKGKGMDRRGKRLTQHRREEEGGGGRVLVQGLAQLGLGLGQLGLGMAKLQLGQALGQPLLGLGRGRGQRRGRGKALQLVRVRPRPLQEKELQGNTSNWMVRLGK